MWAVEYQQRSFITENKAVLDLFDRTVVNIILHTARTVYTKDFWDSFFGILSQHMEHVRSLAGQHQSIHFYSQVLTQGGLPDVTFRLPEPVNCPFIRNRLNYV